ncbi:class I adenylate-forming enzyme family protein [Rhodococcus erythropolis]|uniref:class I adenylate-forming enzyme family protein n=1 Tax=Rhodococcus erythropolis TaxID=1833 RepID=UPI00301333E0
MPVSLDYPDVAFDAILAGSARAYGSRVALRDGDDALTFTELYDHALRIAQGLSDRGVQPGDRVVLLMPNSLWYPVVYFGILCSGAVACPINHTQPTDTLRELLAEFSPRAAVVHPTSVAAFRAAQNSDLELTVIVPPTAAAPENCPSQDGATGDVDLTQLLESPALTRRLTSSQGVAHLQLTGGTTGRSKGVQVLHRNLVASTIQTTAWRSSSLPERDEGGGIRMVPVPAAVHENSERMGEGVVAVVAPYFHGLALVGQCNHVLAGTTTLVLGRFDPVEYLATIERYKVDRLIGAPAFYHLLLEASTKSAHDLGSVRSVFSGAAPIDTTTLRRMGEIFANAKVIEGYGLSEATTILTNQLNNPDARSPIGSVGLPVFDTRISLRDMATEEEVATGEVGEIWASGPQVTAGYFAAPELTALQFRDGWLRTGDLGRFDSEGNLFVVGRSKDMIIYKGYNVYPVQLEEVLCSHPGVAQSAVIGRSNPEVGEIPMAFVVRSTDTKQVSASELVEYVSEKVAPYQRIHTVEFIEALPLTATGKVQKSQLKAMQFDS